MARVQADILRRVVSFLRLRAFVVVGGLSVVRCRVMVEGEEDAHLEMGFGVPGSFQIGGIIIIY